MPPADKCDLFRVKLPARLPVPSRMASLAEGTINRLFSLSKLTDLYLRCQVTGDAMAFLESLHKEMGVTVQVPPEDLARLPAKGPAVVVANHPFGAIEGVVLAKLLLAQRPDVKIMANYLLGRIPELRDLFLCVDPFARENSLDNNLRPLREAIHWVKDGGLLAIFPAGEVAHIGWNQPRILDPPWSPVAARIAQKAKAPVVPAFFSGANSPLFQLVGLVHPLLRTALLPRELVKRFDKTIHLRLGGPISAKRLEEFVSSDEATAYLRWRTYLLKQAAGGDTKWQKPDEAAWEENQAAAALARAERGRELGREIDALPAGQLLVKSGDYRVYCAQRAQIPGLMREIGRLREDTFRQVGEGTGQELDLDRYDDYYHHLILWNQAEREVVGGYRMGPGDEILASQGIEGLYTASLFRFKPGLFEELGPFLELGRSFICPRYQRSYSALMLLWKGIGAFVVANPRYRYLIGTVSVSANYQPLSQRLMVEYFETHLVSELGRHAKPRRPPRFGLRTTGRKKPSHHLTLVDKLTSIEELSDIVAEIEGGPGVPILLRQYLKLSARSLGWNLDPEFGNVLDCLMITDLLAADPKTMVRYCGEKGYRGFLAHYGREAR